MDNLEKLILTDCCLTCKNFDGEQCMRLTRQNQHITPLKSFVCDFYNQKNSGAFRRKRRKLKKILHEIYITDYLINKVFRNEKYYMLHDEETLNDMIWELMEIIASLHNEYYKAVHGEYYDYMFHWVNKMNCGSIIDDIFKKGE